MTQGTSLAVQWLRLHAPNAGGTGSISGRGNKILHVLQCGLKKKSNITQMNLFSKQKQTHRHRKIYSALRGKGVGEG